MEIKRVLDAFQLSHDRRGRRAYVAWLESRATSHGGKIDDVAMELLRTSMENEWIAARVAMGGSTYVSSLVNGLLRDAKARRNLATHERALDADA